MNKNILKKAFLLAIKNKKNKKQSICSIIVDSNNNILSIGYNSYTKTSPLQKKYAQKYGNANKEFNHAEMDALRKIPYGKKPYAIYVARAGANRDKRLAKPCNICQQAIEEAEIKEIYYTKTIKK